MEKDSFENQLRHKILQAESGLNRDSNKEKIWNSIQKERKPKLYYMAAAMLVIIGLVGALYFKIDKSIEPITSTKRKEKPKDSILQKPKILPPNLIEEQAIATIKAVKVEQQIPTKQEESALALEVVNVPKPITTIMISPAADEKIVNQPEGEKGEIVAVSKPLPSLAPEFTVQFKRGKPVGEVESHTKEAIDRLKRFRLSKDTSILANTIEKQKSLFKIKF